MTDELDEEEEALARTLDGVNLTELIQMCRSAKIGNVGRYTSRKDIIKMLVRGDSAPTCPLEEKRSLMESHIKKNYRRLRTQLPGCNGKCVSFGCPDIIVQRCWQGFKEDML